MGGFGSGMIAFTVMLSCFAMLLPIVSAGEQRTSSFATYPLTDTLAGTGLAENLAADGQYFAIYPRPSSPTAASDRRTLKYKTYAADYVESPKKIASKPLQRAVIAPSMLALLYPLDGKVSRYTRSSS